MNENKDLPFHPLGNQLILKQIADPEKIGSIYLPQTGVRKPNNQGVIIAKGEDVPTGKGFELGYTVVYPIHADSMFQIDRITYMLVSCDQILLSDYGYFARLQNFEKSLEDELNS